MTKEEAKRLFAQYIDYDAETPNYYDMEEACKVAIQALEQEPCKVSEYDKDHIWYKGCQYISLRRFLEVKAETEQEPTETWSIKDVADTFERHGLITEQEPKTEQFAKWVASEIFDEMWEYNKDAFAEIACRKLEKLGIVRAKDNEWKLIESKESDHKCHTCKHYTSGERDGSCGSYICKGYSNWESEE